MSAKWVVVDDTDTGIQYNGPWFADSTGSQDSSGNFGPAYRSTLHGATLNASLAYNFSGTGVRVYGSNNLRNDSGVLDPSWECFIDNISIGASVPFQFAENNWLFCEQDTLLDGPHILTVNATIRKSQTFWFDQIQYRPSSTVPLDEKAILIDNLDPQLSTAYGDGWQALGGTANSTGKTNSVFTLQFTGVSLSWYGFIPTEFPHAAATGTYSIDNSTPSGFLLKGLPASSSTLYNQKFFQTDQLAQGKHEIIVLFQGSGTTTPLTLDYLIVQNGSTPVSTSNGTDPSTPNSSPNSPDSAGHSNQDGSKSNIGAIVGGVVGGLAVIGLLILVLWLRRRRRTQLSEKEISNTIPQPFTYAPVSIQASALDGYANQPTRGHNQMPSFSITDVSQSVDPPSTASASIPPTVPSNTNTTGHQMVAVPTREPLINDTNGSGASNSLPLNPSIPYAFPASTATYSSFRSEKERREVEAINAALRPQRQNDGGLPSPPMSDSSTSSRVVVHDDSGIRLPRNVDPELAQEIPPIYTPG